MKTMIRDFKADEKVKTYLGVFNVQQRKAKNGKDYLMFEFYDISGWITGYLFRGVEIFEEIRTHRHVEVTAMTKMHNGKLILQMSIVRGAKEAEFDKRDIFANVSKDDLKKFCDKVYQLKKYLHIRSQYKESR